MSEAASARFRDLPAAILAGGLGRRLSPVIADRPKALAPVCGQPFLAYVLDQLSRAGLRKAIVCTGHGGDQIKAAFGAQFGGLALAYSREASPLGTGGALRLALPILDAPLVLVLNGDSFAEVDLKAFWKWHRARGAAASLALAKLPDTRRYGCVDLSERDEILKFLEKTETAGAGWINAGVYLLNRKIIAGIPPQRPVSLEREIFPNLAGRGLCGWRSCQRFIDIGTPESYGAAAHFLEKFRPANLLTKQQPR